MSNYSQTTFFTPKDSLPSGNPAKTIFGAAYDTEFANISTAIATKPDNLTTASFLNVSVTSASIPSNGIYLAAANTLGFATNATQVATVNANGAWVHNAPVSGNIGVTINAVANSQALQVTAPNTAGQSFGVNIKAGSNASDYALQIQQASGSHQLAQFTGDGSFFIGYQGATNTLVGTAAGLLTLTTNASSGVCFSIASAIGATQSTEEILIQRNAGSTANNLAQGPSIEFLDNLNTTGTMFQHSGGQTEIWQFNGSWLQIVKIDTSHQFNIAAPGSGLFALIANGPASVGGAAANFVASGTSGSNAISIGGGNASTALTFGAQFINTGTATATINANKPGANNTVLTWIRVNCNGSIGWIPVLGN